VRQERAREADIEPAAEMPSSIAISPASLKGWLNTGSTRPVTEAAAVLVRCDTRSRKTSGFGL
jgi:hypothetical protein